MIHGVALAGVIKYTWHILDENWFSCENPFGNYVLSQKVGYSMRLEVSSVGFLLGLLGGFFKWGSRMPSPSYGWDSPLAVQLLGYPHGWKPANMGDLSDVLNASSIADASPIVEWFIRCVCVCVIQM